jgi:hypothetical protein
MAQMLTPGQQIEGVRVHSHLAEGAKAVSYLGEEDPEEAAHHQADLKAATHSTEGS